MLNLTNITLLGIIAGVMLSISWSRSLIVYRELVSLPLFLCFFTVGACSSLSNVYFCTYITYYTKCGALFSLFIKIHAYDLILKRICSFVVKTYVFETVIWRIWCRGWTFFSFTSGIDAYKLPLLSQNSMGFESKAVLEQNFSECLFGSRIGASFYRK